MGGFEWMLELGMAAGHQAETVCPPPPGPQALWKRSEVVGCGCVSERAFGRWRGSGRFVGGYSWPKGGFRRFRPRPRLYSFCICRSLGGSCSIVV